MWLKRSQATQLKRDGTIEIRLVARVEKDYATDGGNSAMKRNFNPER